MKFKIIKIDPETKRISVGIKQMFKDPYENLEKKYKVNDICKAHGYKVCRIRGFCENYLKIWKD